MSRTRGQYKEEITTVCVGQRFAEEKIVLSFSAYSLIYEADLGRQYICPWVRGATHVTLRGTNRGQVSLIKDYGKY